MSWTRSSFCLDSECVEVLTFPDGSVLLRKAGEPLGKALHFTAAEWDAFIKGVRAGEFPAPAS